MNDESMSIPEKMKTDVFIVRPVQLMIRITKVTNIAILFLQMKPN